MLPILLLFAGSQFLRLSSFGNTAISTAVNRTEVDKGCQYPESRQRKFVLNIRRFFLLRLQDRALNCRNPLRGTTFLRLHLSDESRFMLRKMMLLLHKCHRFYPNFMTSECMELVGPVVALVEWLNPTGGPWAGEDND